MKMNIDTATKIVERHGLDHIPDQGSHWIDLAEHLEKYELLLETLEKIETQPISGYECARLARDTIAKAKGKQ